MSKVCIVGLQWGDEGKGKIIDALAKDADCVVRFQGGNNAGHTIVHDGKKYKLSLIPSGILHPKTISYIGTGTIIDYATLTQEIENFKPTVKDIDKKLKVSALCGVILDIHKQLDQALETTRGASKIGTTLKGIGFAYQDKVNRLALRVCDLRSPALIKERLSLIYKFYSPILEKHNLIPKNLEEYAAELHQCWQSTKHLVEDDPFFITSSKFNNVIFEGAQGVLLDMYYGTYPYVTSSNSISSALHHGAMPDGERPKKIIGILKAYTTRVGEGPFPTEDHGDLGNFLIEEGKEFGTVTNRKRRCGPLDLVLAKYAAKLCSVTDLVITKLDVLNKLSEIKVCTSYKLNGKTINYLPHVLLESDKFEPVYETLPGWETNMDNITNADDLPQNAKNYLSFIEDFLQIKITLISRGASRKDTIFKSPIWE